MATTTLQKLNTEFHTMRREMRSLRSLVIGMAVHDRDPEGEYRPEFVKQMLSLMKRSKPTGKFKDAETFLKEIQQA